MPSPIFFSRPSFSLESILRGAQLTVVGINRVLYNPELRRHGFYRKALIALGASVVLQLILWMPLWIVKLVGNLCLYMGLISPPSSPSLDRLVSLIDFVQNNVLNVGYLMIGLTRFLRPDLDDLFLLSLAWVDYTYILKHPEARPPNTQLSGVPAFSYSPSPETSTSFRSSSSPRTSTPRSRSSSASPAPVPAHSYYARLVSYKPLAIPGTRKRTPSDLITRYVKWAALMAALWVASLLPYVGWMAFPLMSCYEMSSIIGAQPETMVPLLLILGHVVPKRWSALFVGTFWGARNLVSELLQPYFRRLPLAEAQRRRWYLARSGILFGFGAGFHLAMKIPFLGIFVYGLAQASSAYLITKVSDPPPSHDQFDRWTETQLLYQYEWGKKNK